MRTSADVIVALRVEMERSLELIDRQRVHDARVQGQRESIAHIQTVLFNLMADGVDDAQSVLRAEPVGKTAIRVTARPKRGKQLRR